MRTAYSVKARSVFVQNTNLRGFDGRLLFDHTNERLKMTVRVVSSSLDKALDLRFDPDPDYARRRIPEQSIPQYVQDAQTSLGR